MQRTTALRRASFAALVVLAALAGLPLVLVAPPAAHADTLTAAPAMSGHKQRATAISDGRDIYIFGGNTQAGYAPGTSNKIVRFSPSTGTYTTMNATLNPSIGSSSGIWDGKAFYLFGGFSSLGFGTTRDEIYKYDPVADVVTVLPTRLFSPRAFTSAVWTGTYAYIFGGSVVPDGYTGPGVSVEGEEILRFDPATGAVTTMAAKLPSHRSSTAAGWDGTLAWIAGGRVYGGYTNQIVAFHPGLDVAVVVPQTLPYAGEDMGSFWNGQDLVTISGAQQVNENKPYYTTYIQTWTPSSGRVGYMSKSVGERSGTFAVWHANAAWTFGGLRVDCVSGGYGGCTSYWTLHRDAFRYTMEPGRPRMGVGAYPWYDGSVYVSWSPPEYGTYTSLTKYRVARREYGIRPDGTFVNTPYHVIAETHGEYANAYYDKTCPTGLTCWYRVTAVNPFGESVPSAESIGVSAPIAGYAPV